MLIDKILSCINGNNKTIETKVTYDLLQDVRREIPQIREKKQEEEKRKLLDEELKRATEIRRREREKNQDKDSSGITVSFKLSFPKEETFQELLLEKLKKKT